MILLSHSSLSYLKSSLMTLDCVTLFVFVSSFKLLKHQMTSYATGFTILTCVLVESKFAMTPDTESLSMSFEHSELLRTFMMKELKYCCIHIPARRSMDYGIIRIVRVVPEDTTRPRTTICCLPTELLLKIFEAIDSCEWQHDLLSFPQVCRRWSCSMGVLFARLEYPERKNHCRFPWLSNQSPDPYAFAKAFTETPVLGLGIQHLVLDEHSGLHAYQGKPAGFTPALIAILRATKDLQRLHISQVYSSRANAIFSALPELAHLRTLSVTQSDCPSWPERYRHNHNSISTVQLARSMAHWPALTSLTVEDLVPDNLGMRRFFLRLPRCALTQLCFRNLDISDTDLLHLTASSTNTLVQVGGITSAGLHTFLYSISQQVTSLAVIRLGEDLFMTRTTEHALDTVVDKMWCLEVLRIEGNVASECMLRRRYKMFARSRSSGDAAVPYRWFDCQPCSFRGLRHVHLTRSGLGGRSSYLTSAGQHLLKSKAQVYSQTIDLEIAFLVNQ